MGSKKLLKIEWEKETYDSIIEEALKEGSTTVLLDTENSSEISIRNLIDWALADGYIAQYNESLLVVSVVLDEKFF